MDGIWFSVAIACLLSIYYSLCNVWLLYRPFKIILSKSSKKLLKEYAVLQQRGENINQQSVESQTFKIPVKSIKQVRKEILEMSSLSRFIKSMEESIFIRLPIVVITVVLTIAIFNESIISFGYIVIVMLLMTDLVRLSANNENSESFRKKLRWVLVPYLLLDVLS